MGQRPEIIDLCSKGFGGDLDAQEDSGKRIKMKDLDSVLKYGGMKKCSMSSDSKAHSHTSKEEATSQITDANRKLTSDSFIEPTTGIDLSLGLDTIKFSANQPDSQLTTSSNLNLDLKNPFHPYKKLGQMAPIDASECGSTTGPLEESEPLKRWKEMKQRGFVSSSHGYIPTVPKYRNRQPKRKKEEDIKKKNDLSKREPPNKYTRIAAPTGLLSGLNPGIIKHVRNSKQVNSIIEAMLKCEKSVRDKENRSMDFLAHNYTSSQFGFNLNMPSFLSNFEQGSPSNESDFTGKFYNENYTLTRFNSEVEDDSLALKLSSENPTSASNIDLPASHDIASLSMKGASIASQWLDLLQQDIKGRLASLKKSKKRVRNVIQLELPYLMSKESSCEGTSSKKANLSLHMQRWKSIFSQMEKSLQEESKHLENWLKQVQDMQSHCEGGIKYFSANRTVLLAEEFSGLKKTEVLEKENAVRAAAASIYSTCNMITTKEKNVPCF